MRVPDDRLRSSVRFSLGAGTTEAEIEAACPASSRSSAGSPGPANDGW